MGDAGVIDRRLAVTFPRTSTAPFLPADDYLAANSTDMMHAFTIDVEDYFHVSAFSDRISIQDWEHLERRVEVGTRRLLALLDRFGVKATFFVLGWVAERHPELVHEIRNSGHEIASHSQHHRLVYDLDPEEFRADLRQSRDVLEQLTGEPVAGYRAPTFSITRKSLWALDVLAEEGFLYDSSIFPIRHDRYGIPEATLGPHPIQKIDAHRDLWEFPGTVCRMAGMRVPAGGGGYFRLYPYAFSAYLLRQATAQTSQPFMFYIHPWELDPEQPQLPGSWMRRWRHRVNLASTEARLEKLLAEFSFGTMSRVLNESAQRKSAPVSPDLLAGNGTASEVDAASPEADLICSEPHFGGRRESLPEDRTPGRSHD